MSYEFLLTLHIASIILLLGVGGGSAFYKFMSDKSGNLEVILHTNKLVVLADWLFTTPSIIMQPLTGYMLVELFGISWSTPWLYTATLLYIFSTILWFVAVWIQIKMKNLAQDAYENSSTLPPFYKKLVLWWIALGIFSFMAMAWIFVLMIWK